MLTIRMQRVGRSGQAHFRVVVQDSRQSPKSGKFVALLGSYDPHTKTTTLQKEKAQVYIKNGAQPSYRVANLLKAEGVKLPDWVAKKPKKSGKVKNPDKRAKEQAEPKADKAEAETKKDETTEASQTEAPAEKAPEEDSSSEALAKEETTVLPEPATDNSESEQPVAPPTAAGEE